MDEDTYNTNRFCDVIKIVAENGFLEPKEIIKCGPYIGEEHQILAWKRASEKYKKYMENDHLWKEGECVNFEKGTDLCSTTRAKKEFKLDEDDLFSLPWKNVYVRKARSHFPFYKTSDVILTMYKKYGKYKSKDIKERKGKREIRKQTLQDERKNYIDTQIGKQSKHRENLPPSFTYLFDDLECDILRTRIVKSFLTNGKYKRFIKWYIDTSFENLVILSKHLPLSYVSKYTIRDTIDSDEEESIVYDVIADVQDEINRKEKLIAELNKYGLSLRSDSTVCNDYLMGKRNDLAEVVEIMREMHFYYEYTKYSDIIGTEYNKIFKRIEKNRERNRFYGEYDEYDDDYEEIDRGEISSNCKVKAINEFCKRKKNDHVIEIPKNVLEMLGSHWINSHTDFQEGKHILKIW